MKKVLCVLGLVGAVSAMDRMSMMRNAAQKGDVNGVAHCYVTPHELYICTRIVLDASHKDFWQQLVSTGKIPLPVQYEVGGIADENLDNELLRLIAGMKENQR